MEKRKEAQRVEYIDSFRGIACIIVLFVHLWYNMAENMTLNLTLKMRFMDLGNMLLRYFLSFLATFQ